jgi:putative heme-binding domain-containing protein
MQILLPKNEALKDLWEEVAGELRRVLRLSGGNADYVRSPLTLSGPFTVETWIRLEPGINNADGILGLPRMLDMNFHDQTLRVWIANQGDIVVAKQKVVADSWTHVAVTRDAQGKFRIYVNGELSAESAQNNTSTFSNLNIGRTLPNNTGTEGALIEYRIWDFARAASQIRDNFDRSFSGEDLPEGLVHYFDGTDWGKLSGKARVQPTLESPKLLTALQAKQQAELFAKYRRLAQQSGDAAAGKAIFTKICLVCHQHAEKGGNIGPALDGIGLTGTEALLRNTLTPSAAMEGGYKNYQVLTRAGKIVQGLLVSEDSNAVVLRQQDTADLRIAKSDIERAGFTSLSVMPDGLLDSLKPREVSDLFTHLHSLKQSQKPADK